MDPIAIIDQFYGSQPVTRDLLIRHSRNVAGYARELAARNPYLKIDARFVVEAAMLHDIGIIHTRAPDLGCVGDLPYVAHGYMGRRMLEDLGLPRHGLVCERHVGCGITREDIRKRSLPLPGRDMLPVSIEERLVCYADKFFSKKRPGEPDCKCTVEEVIRNLERFDEQQVERFIALRNLFESDLHSNGLFAGCVIGNSK